MSIKEDRGKNRKSKISITSIKTEKATSSSSEEDGFLQAPILRQKWLNKLEGIFLFFVSCFSFFCYYFFMVAPLHNLKLTFVLLHIEVYKLEY